MDGKEGMFKLNSTNYSTWKCMMEDLLYCKDLYKPIKLGSAKPADISEGDWEVMHRKTVGHIRRWVDQNVFEDICDETKAHVVWKKLENLFEKKTTKTRLL